MQLIARAFTVRPSAEVAASALALHAADAARLPLADADAPVDGDRLARAADQARRAGIRLTFTATSSPWRLIARRAATA